VIDDLMPVRLWWSADRGRGIARYDGVEVRLRTRPPVLMGTARLIEIDYSPAIGCLYVQEATCARRDMQPGEAAECREYLRAVSEDARRRAEMGAA
jgi:hypothetical protein